MRVLRAWLSPRADPVTGDLLRPAERASWAVQGVMRRWAFIAAYSALTFIWWTHPGLFGDPGLSSWNRWASLSALWIESVVGLAMFGQVRRDAVIIRELRKAVQATVRNEAHVVTLIDALAAREGIADEHGELIRRIVAAVETDTPS